MIKTALISLLTLILCACGSVNFKPVALYDGYAEPDPQEKIEPIIFEEGVGTMWNSLFDCGSFEITKEAAHEGNTSIKISWDKSKGCEWIGFGNSFSNWTSADLSEDRFKKALSFYVRTQTKTAKSIPIVANLEDFGGGGSYYFIDAGKYLYGLEMDTTWKQIIVPLWDFPIIEEEVDIYSIKQMKFQLEGAGSFYLDDMKLIDYTKEEYQKMREEVELMKPKGEVNQLVYKEGDFEEAAWGAQNNRCQTLEERTDASSSQYIYWKFDSKDCSWAKWGMNWNGWYQINFRGIVDEAKLQFKVKASKSAKYKVVLQDFRGHSATLYTSPSNTTNHEEWQTVEVRLKDINLKDKNFVLDQIRQLQFEGSGAGEVCFDDIKIIGS